MLTLLIVLYFIVFKNYLVDFKIKIYVYFIVSFL